MTPSRPGLFLPLTLLYYFTFYFNRELVEIWDKILNSDTPRYLEEAASFRVQARHLGFPIVTFPYVATNRLGSTLFGAPSRVREGLESWRAAGIATPIVVPSSVAGNQLKAFEGLFAAFA